MFGLFYCSCVLLLAFTTETLSVESNSRSHEHKIRVRRTPSNLVPDLSVDKLFKEYGKDKQMNLAQLEKFLKDIGVSTSSKTAGNETCLSSGQFYSKYSGNDGVNISDFVDLCAAVLYQSSKPTCSLCGSEAEEEESKGKEDPQKAWGYGFLFVTIICVLCLAGAFVVPFMDKRIYKIVLMFMVSLAVGVLFGSAIFHLIPSTFGFSKGDPDRNLFIGKCATIVAGMYLFFLLEYMMKLYVRFKAMNKQIDIGSHQDEKYKDGAETQNSTVYSNNNPGHGHSHGVQNDVGGGEIVTKMGEKKRIATVAWMIIVGDGLHNFIDGLAIGASFSTSAESGISTSLAVMAEELPHELGDFAILLNSGFSYKQAMLANFLSACMCYVGLVIGLILGYKTKAVKYIKGVAGGMFIYISLVDMLPESLEMTRALSGNSKLRSIMMLLLQNFAMLLGFTVMLILSLDFAKIKI